jgi:hypothetical protein
VFISGKKADKATKSLLTLARIHYKNAFFVSQKDNVHMALTKNSARQSRVTIYVWADNEGRKLYDEDFSSVDVLNKVLMVLSDGVGTEITKEILASLIKDKSPALILFSKKDDTKSLQSFVTFGLANLVNSSLI